MMQLNILRLQLSSCPLCASAAEAEAIDCLLPNARRALCALPAFGSCSLRRARSCSGCCASTLPMAALRHRLPNFQQLHLSNHRPGRALTDRRFWLRCARPACRHPARCFPRPLHRIRNIAVQPEPDLRLAATPTALPWNLDIES
jgi:hypothetical protein